ncbi:MAG: nucleotidyltransferase family protein [Acidimicrobiales bacterium]
MLTRAGAGVVEVAVEHGIAGFLALFLRGLPGVPAELARSAERARRAALAQHLRVVSTLNLVSGVLQGLGAPWVVIKGPALSSLVYSRPDLRSYGDLDVVVHHGAFGDALAALEHAGCTVLDQNWPLVRAMHRGELSLRMPGGTILDLHWHLLNEPELRHAFTVPVPEALSRRHLTSIHGTPVAVLDPTDAVLHLILHGGLSGGHRLVWYADLQQSLVHRPPDWDALCSRALDAGAGDLASVMLLRCRRLLGIHVPEQTWRSLCRRSPWGSGLRALSRLSSTTELVAGRRTGRSLFLATRSHAGESFAALSREAVRHMAAWPWLPEGLRRRNGSDPTIEMLRRPSADDGARSAYLRAVTTGVGP